MVAGDHVDLVALRGKGASERVDMATEPPDHTRWVLPGQHEDAHGRQAYGSVSECPTRDTPAEAHVRPPPQRSYTPPPDGGEERAHVTVVVGALLVVLGAVGASVIARTMATHVRGPRLALAVAPTGVLIGTGAALVRGWDVVGSAVVGAMLVALLALTTGMRIEPRRRSRS